MKQLCLTLLLTFGFVASPFAEKSRYDRFAVLLETANDQVVQRVVVPSIEQPQGEVQLIRRNNLLVVRTLLASRVLKRVGASIDAKERRNWPESRDGYVASIRYRDELFRAIEQSWERFRKRTDPTETRQFLAIEFILADDSAAISLSVPSLAGDYGSMSLSAQDVVQTWKTSQHYVHNNILEIVRDSFRLDEQAASQLLASLWPDSGDNKK
jgi:hypothetical protein